MTPATAQVMRQLGDLGPSTLAIMHGRSYRGDGGKALYALAAAYVECTVGDQIVWGVGVDANIVTASLKAVISAVNRG